jgi:hypothetical protein
MTGHPLFGIKFCINARKLSNASLVCRVQIDHHGEGALTHAMVMVFDFMLFKVVCVRFELLSHLIVLTLYRFRVGFMDSQEPANSLIDVLD